MGLSVFAGGCVVAAVRHFGGHEIVAESEDGQTVTDYVCEPWYAEIDGPSTSTACRRAAERATEPGLAAAGVAAALAGSATYGYLWLRRDGRTRRHPRPVSTATG